MPQPFLFLKNATQKRPKPNPEEIKTLVTSVIKENQDIVERLEDPEDKLVGFLVGQVMKSSVNKVNPGSVKDILLKELFG